MSAKIQVLPPEVASRIAAGEVIERPASMLKELLENSLDAGASRVSIEALGAGRASLRISDDGSGMSADDCALSLERHATSKLRSLEDLQRLGTFGFRGEALYAISAVSRLTLSSARRGDKTGWKIVAEGGRIVSSGPAPAVPGTTIEVRDLFFNTPARLKFLKSDAFEKAKLAAVVEEAALANPRIRLVYKSESRVALNFQPADDGRRLEEVLGKDLSRGLLSIPAERPGMNLRLYVSSPDALASSRGFQYWFVNKRPVTARILQQALYKAYEGQRGSAKHPVCVAHLDLSPDSFDVNVHPGKREIRFRSDQEMFGVISGLIASAFYKAKSAAPITAESKVREPEPGYYLGGRGFIPGITAKAAQPAATLPLTSAPSDSLAAPAGAPRWFTPPFRYLGQIERSYLLFEARGGLFMLDQHAAAERILYERYLDELEKGAARSQKLMLPLPIELPASGVQKALSKKARLEQLGFSIAPYGKTTLHFLAAPALLQKGADLKEMVHRLLDSLEDPLGAVRGAKHDAVATIACKAAVKAHDPLGEKEALRLLEDLRQCRDGTCCPHGRRSMLSLDRDELARRFQRPGAVPL
jgi:DNA mismatch repair protein MutL